MGLAIAASGILRRGVTGSSKAFVAGGRSRRGEAFSKVVLPPRNCIVRDSYAAISARTGDAPGVSPVRSGRLEERSASLPKGGGEHGVFWARPFRGPALMACRWGEEQRSSPLAKLGSALHGSAVARGVHARPCARRIGDAGRPANVFAIPELVICGDWTDVEPATLRSPLPLDEGRCLRGEGGKLAIAPATPALVLCGLVSRGVSRGDR